MANKQAWTRGLGRALALGTWLALGTVAAAALVATPAAADSKKEKKPELSADVRAKLAPAQEASKKEDWDTMLARSQEALAASKTDYDRQQSINFIRTAYGKKKDYANWALYTEQYNDNPLTPEEERVASYHNLATIYANQKDYEKALKYGQLWAANGGGYEAKTLVWQLYLIQKDCEHGVIALEQAVDGREASEQELGRMNYCYYQLKNEPKREAVLTTLVEKFPNKDYYHDLLSMYQEQKMDPRAEFNFLRLMFAKDMMTRESEYVRFSDDALDVGAPAEASAAMEQGISQGAVKLITATDHNSTVRQNAKALTAEDKKTIAALDREAQAGQNGEKDVKVGLAYLGLGDAQKAVDSIKRGLSPGRVEKVKRVDEANMNLGIAYLKLGDKDKARAAFTAAKADPRMAKVADLWIATL